MMCIDASYPSSENNIMGTSAAISPRHLAIGGLVVSAVVIVLYRSTQEAQSNSREERESRAARAHSASSISAPSLERSVEASPTAPEATQKQDPRLSFQLGLAAHDKGEVVAPAEVRTAIATELARTGPTSESWTHSAETVFADLGREISNLMPGADTHVSSAQCFAAGCIVNISYDAKTDHTEYSDRIADTVAVRSWNGSKLCSPSVKNGAGSNELSFVLLRPNEI